MYVLPVIAQLSATMDSRVREVALSIREAGGDRVAARREARQAFLHYCLQAPPFDARGSADALRHDYGKSNVFGTQQVTLELFSDGTVACVFGTGDPAPATGVELRLLKELSAQMPYSNGELLRHCAGLLAAELLDALTA